MEIDPEQFWEQPKRWPLDLNGYVFLARAVRQVTAGHLVPVQPSSQADPRRWRESFAVATERLAKAAAQGEIKTATLKHDGAFCPISRATWAQLDRDKLFQTCFLSPGGAGADGRYECPSHPIYVEARSLYQFVKWTVTMAEAAEAQATFARVKSDRYSYETRPAMLPPPDFVAFEEMLAFATAEGEDEAAARDRIRRLASAGDIPTVLQFWETGIAHAVPPEIWRTPDAGSLLDNGIVAVPDHPGADAAFSSWAYVRFGLPSSSSLKEQAHQPRALAPEPLPPSSHNLEPIEPVEAKPLHPLVTARRRQSRRVLEALIALRGENLGLGTRDIPALAAQVDKHIRDANSAVKDKRDQDVPADTERAIRDFHSRLSNALKNKA